eukprot:1159483-Pelagomonas_calceolata.AAC.9
MRRGSLLLMLLITGSMLCFSTGVDSVEKAVGISAVANSHVEAQIEIADCGDKKACKLSLLVTYPGLSSGLAAPVYVQYRFAMLRTGEATMPRSWYDSYAEQLASSGGYAVVQYETSSSIVKPLIPDMIEVWGAAAADKSSSMENVGLKVLRQGQDRGISGVI